MSHLPPPPPNAAPYAPPPPQGGQQYPYPYQAQPPYPPPPTVGYNNPPYQQNGYGQDQSSPPRNGPPGPPKSKMQVTRYPPPPGRRPYPGQQAPLSQPSPVPPYPPPNWAPPPYGPLPPNYPPPPPQAAGHYPPPQRPPQHPQHPPPPANQAPYAGYNQAPPPYPPPYPPPPQPNTYPQYPPPPVNQSNPPWSAPQAPPPQHQPQPAWSPPPSISSQLEPLPPRTPAQSFASNAPPVGPYSTGLELIKDRNDPTFYDDWDKDEFDMDEVVWPKSNDAIDERFSIGQYIWHPAERITRAISSNFDIPLLPVPVAQRHSRAEELIVSKFFQGKENENEGLEYIYTFQRIRNVEDEWAERKDDPIFRRFSPEDIDKYLDVEQVKEQVLEDARRLRESDPKGDGDVMGSLEQALSSYIGTAVPSAAGSSTGAPDGKPAKGDATEALLASLGVSGEAKPVYTTPFPAYAPPSEDQIFTPSRRTSSAQPPYQAPPPQHAKPPPPQPYNAPLPQHLQPPPPSAHRPPPHMHPSYPNQPPPIVQYPNRPPPHIGYQNYPPPPPPPTSGYQPSTPSYNRKRSASVDSFADPWKVGTGRDNTPSAHGPGTPVGSDFGDFQVNGSASENTLKAESRSPPPIQSGDHGDYKKRKIDEHDGLQRKRSKPKVNVDSAYQRRW